MQICEVPMLICLHDFSCLNALLLYAEIFTVDSSPSNLRYLKISSPDHQYIFCYEIVNICLCFNPRKWNTPHTLIHEVS